MKEVRVCECGCVKKKKGEREREMKPWRLVGLAKSLGCISLSLYIYLYLTLFLIIYVGLRFAYLIRLSELVVLARLACLFS